MFLKRIYSASVSLGRRVAIMSFDRSIPTDLSSTMTLNDGVVMPLFGLGAFKLASGDGGEAETITFFALQNGYRLIDTASY